MYPNFGKPTSEIHDFIFGTREIRPIQDAESRPVQLEVNPKIGQRGHEFDSSPIQNPILAGVQNTGPAQREGIRPIQDAEIRPIQFGVTRPILAPSLETEPIV